MSIPKKIREHLTTGYYDRKILAIARLEDTDFQQGRDLSYYQEQAEIIERRKPNFGAIIRNSFLEFGATSLEFLLLPYLSVKRMTHEISLLTDPSKAIDSPPYKDITDRIRGRKTAPYII